MQTGRKLQMQTMDTVLLDLYQRGEITYDMALSNAREARVHMLAERRIRGCNCLADTASVRLCLAR